MPIDLDNLKNYMDSNNISHYKLAKMIGVDYTTVYRVFKGTRKPGTKFISGLLSSGIRQEFFLNTLLPTGNKETIA